VDAKDQVWATIGAARLPCIGAAKTNYLHPQSGHGDHVVVINAEKVRMTGKKV